MKDAVDTYETIVQKYATSDESAKALAALGQLMIRQQNYQKAYTYYHRLAGKGAKHQAEGYVGMGDALLAMGQNQNAQEQYQSALSVSSNNEAAQVGLAKVAIQNKNYELADQKLRPVAQENSTETGAQAQYLLGLTQQKQNHFKQALQAYAKLQSLYQNDDHWMALAMLKSGQCYYKLDKKALAQKTLQKLIKSYPQSRQAQQAQQMLKGEK